MVTNTIEIGTARRPLRRVTRAARTAVSPRTPRPATHRTRLPGQAPQVPAPAASLPVARAARPVAFALAVLAVLATVAPEQAAAQTETTFLSNTGQFANTSANTVRATAFTTGAGTYTLSSVAVYSPNQPDPPTPLVQIYGDTSSNPGTLVATMTNPGTIAENALNIFTAPANTTLAASTTYWLVTSNTATNFGTGFQVATNSNSNVDSGTAAGWTIGNGLLKTDIRLAPWTNSSNRHRFEIRGTVRTAAPTVANAIPDQTATVGRAFTYQFPANTFNDTDTGDTLSYMATKADGTMLPTWLGFTASTRTFAGTPAASDVETVSVKVTATDTTSATVSDEFDITVSADTNSAPTVVNAIPDQTAMAGTAFTYQVPANTFNDTDTSDTLSYTATKADGANLPTWLGFTASTRTFMGTPAATDVETVAVKVTADDSNGGTVSDEFNIVVGPDTTTEMTFISNTGLTPSSSSDSLRATSFTTGTGTYTLSSVAILVASQSGTPTPVVQIYGNAGGNPGTLVATMTNPATLMSSVVNIFTAPANTTLAASTTYWLVTSNSASTSGTGFRVNVRDNGDRDSGTAAGWTIDNARSRSSTADPWSIHISRIQFQIRGTRGAPPANSAPTVANAIPDQTATVGAAFSYQFPTNTFNDTDTGDTLSYTATKADGTDLPTWLVFTAGTRTFTGMPAASDVETVSVKVTADQQLTVSDEQHPGERGGPHHGPRGLGLGRRQVPAAFLSSTNESSTSHGARFRVVGSPPPTRRYGHQRRQGADDYQDFYDGNWDDERSGTATAQLPLHRLPRRGTEFVSQLGSGNHVSASPLLRCRRRPPRTVLLSVSHVRALGGLPGRHPPGQRRPHGIQRHGDHERGHGLHLRRGNFADTASGDRSLASRS